jgi:hypothetical protein
VDIFLNRRKKFEENRVQQTCAGVVKAGKETKRDKELDFFVHGRH